MTNDLMIHEPSMTASETQMLCFAIERSRAQFAWKTGGLGAAALTRAYPPSTMTMGGLIKHLAFVEDQRTAVWVTGQPMVGPWRATDFDADPDGEWHSAAADSPGQLYALWHDAVARSRTALADALARGGPDQQSTYVTPSGRSPNLRRSLVDLHDEYARHVGHADLMREAIDGLVGEDPPQP
jgi:hypothetical protein